MTDYWKLDVKFRVLVPYWGPDHSTTSSLVWHWSWIAWGALWQYRNHFRDWLGRWHFFVNTFRKPIEVFSVSLIHTTQTKYEWVPLCLITVPLFPSLGSIHYPHFSMVWKSLYDDICYSSLSLLLSLLAFSHTQLRIVWEFGVQLLGYYRYICLKFSDHKELCIQTINGVDH